MPYIPELLEKAEFVRENSYTPETEKNIKAYWKADVPISIDGKTLSAQLTVKEDDKGNLFWDAQIKEEARRTVSATNQSVGGLTSSALSADNLNITLIEPESNTETEGHFVDDEGQGALFVMEVEADETDSKENRL